MQDLEVESRVRKEDSEAETHRRKVGEKFDFVVFNRTQTSRR